MITLFTTTKDFKGKNAINQQNAINSWLSSSYNVEVIIFGQSEGLSYYENHERVVFYKEVQTSSTGIPFISSMFLLANEIAKYPICCFVNADIIITEVFFKKAIHWHQQLKKEYLIVGQRLDVDVEESILFDKGWEVRFFDTYGDNMELHPPAGSDYFIFPKGQYTSMPDLLVGRPGWDLWMIYNARASDYLTIDFSEVEKVIHQNHDYNHKIKIEEDIEKDDEAQFNLKHLPIKGKYKFTLAACNYKINKNDLLEINYARGDIYEAIRIYDILGHQRPKSLIVRHIKTALKNRVRKVLQIFKNN